MPVLQTLGSISARAYGFSSASVTPTILINGQVNNGLGYAYNGVGLSLGSPDNSWAVYQNLPTYLQGAVSTLSINDGNFNFTVSNSSVTAYMLRSTAWSVVDLTGWTLLESNTTYISGYGATINVYTKNFVPGTYTSISTTSAMYLWGTQAVIDKQMPATTFGLGYWWDGYNYAGGALNDLSPNAFNASFTGTPVVGSNSVVFSKTQNVYATIPSGSSLDSTTGYSLNMWLKPTADNTTWVRFFGKSAGYPNGNLLFFEAATSAGGNSRVVECLTHTSTQGEVRTPVSSPGACQIPLNSWSMVTMNIIPGNSMTLYINGVQASTVALTGTLTAQTSGSYALMGAETGEYFNGELGEVLVYTRSLSPREIASNYAAQVTRYNTTAATATGNRSFVLIPAVNGNTVWNLDTQGPLSITTPSNSQYVIPLKSFNASVKVWGAGGGCRITSGGANKGGGGGYAGGNVTFNPLETYLGVIGSGGKNMADNTASSNYPLGYGFGGQGPAIGYAGQGGGLSGLFATQLGQASAVIVGGGGGGGGVDGNTNGGGGGGLVGEDGYDPSGKGAAYRAGSGGTQTAVGVNGYNNPSGSVAPSGFQGGSSGSGGDSGGGGGGGGGYYGGGAGFNGDSPSGNNGGAGGSGYIAPFVSTGVLTAAVAYTPGNSSDSARGAAALGASSTGSLTTAGNGLIYIF